MAKHALIIGLDTAFVDFSEGKVPPGTTAESIMAGLNGNVDQLKAAGHGAELVMVDSGDTAAAVLSDRLRGASFDVVVIGAGIRVLPANAALFETLVNVVRAEAPQARLAFNTKPDDSALAALRHL